MVRWLNTLAEKDEVKSYLPCHTHELVPLLQHTVNMVQVVEHLTGKGVSKEEALEVWSSTQSVFTVYMYILFSSSVKWTEMERGRWTLPIY